MNEKAADESDLASWLVCRAARLLCAVPLARVIEVMRILPIEQLSGAPSYVRGLSIVRGAPIPVVDLASLLGDPATRPERLVAIRTGDRTAALAVDSVVGVRAIEAGASRDLPPLLRNATRETVAAIGVLDAELLFFLQGTRIVPEDLIRGLDALEPAG